MTGQFVPLLVVLVVSSFDRVDAVSCYQCNYTNSAFLGSSTCSEPFNATNAGNCSAPMCTWQLANYMSPMSFSLLYRDCADDSTVMLPEHCEQYSPSSNYTTFIYGDNCCYTTGLLGDQGITYSQTICFCQKDNCNGNIPLTLGPPTVAPANTTTKSANSMPLLKPSISGSWALVVVTIVWMAAEIISTG